MPLPEDLLTPIAETRPGGDDVRYDPIYDQIKEARREDEDLPTGGWDTTRKTADWALVVKLGSEVLARRSKDLQVAVWLAEAHLRREGYPGLSESLALIRGLLEQFWDNLYPEIEDGDSEFRAAPLDWLGSRLDLAVKSVPLNRSGHSFFDYLQSRAVGYENEAGKQESRAEAIQEGKLTAEDFDKGFDATPKSWYRELVTGLEASLAELDRLDEISHDRFQEYAPGYGGLRNSLEEVLRTGKQLLGRKLELDPDPIQMDEPAAADTEHGPEYAGTPGDDPHAAAASTNSEGGNLPLEPSSYADAAQRVIAAARFLRRTEPTSPTPYLMLRALRWGELRVGGGAVDPKLLEAPPGAVRTQLRGFLLDGKWAQLLETAESVMATGAGRGWLDLQRYVVRSCAELGADYTGVQRAVLGELRALLAEVPGLLDMTLMDDMPTANPETRAWLQGEVLGTGTEDPDGDSPSIAAVLNGGPDRVLARALSEVKAGRVNRAVEVLMRELDRETSRRGRFLRQAQLAAIMVDSGLESVATPILEEMLEVIESHRLEEWEAGPLVAQPLALLYRCLKTDEDNNYSTMNTLYLRLCRLDPVQAISVRS
jgi:type VI secretion system protein ImpA